ncbi:MAG: MBL fold metallo-hydrolase [Rhizobacter sp.]|nr:MBL fold metallo-hydrolase [Rhizobacter sp.]
MSAAATPSREERSPLVSGQGIERVAEGLYLLHGQGQSFVAETDVGLVVVDAGPGGSVTRGMIEALRTVSQAPVHAVCFSHGHLGYNVGAALWADHAQTRGDAPPRLIAQANLPRRLARYRETWRLQQRMAEIQFRRPEGFFEKRLLAPDPTETFDQALTIGHGERRIELLWAPSETDDAIAVWAPAQRVLYGGPSLIHSIPNIGTPLRTLRDTVRWAATLERLAALGAHKAVREFGPVVEGADQVRHVLLHTARALRWLREQVVALMNEGLGEREVLARMTYPDELFGPEWMQPTYGDPSYIVRDIWRSENGWWDRNPTSLHPEPPQAVALALGHAISDKAHVIATAQQHAQAGRLQLALHVIDLLATAEGGDPEIAQARQLKAQWLRLRAQEVRSYVSRSLYLASADLIERRPEGRFGIR